MSSLYDIPVRTIEGASTTLAPYRGDVMLIINVASECGFTRQYAALQELYETYQDQGFTVLGFPCNQFGGQEPGTEAEIKEFCISKYSVTFPLFAKIEVNGDNAHPLFELLKQQAPGILGTEAIKWNFTKFIVDRRGVVRSRHAPNTNPGDLHEEIEALLAEPAMR